jgi:hypothetical protein
MAGRPKRAYEKMPDLPRTTTRRQYKAIKHWVRMSSIDLNSITALEEAQRAIDYGGQTKMHV